MNKYEKQSIKKYDKLAANYDNTFDGKFTAKFKEKILELCEVTDGEKVLDVGCGNGSLIYAISQKANIEAFGIDISPKMIDECKAKYKGINFELTNGKRLPFKDNSLDKVIICCSLHHLDNPLTFIAEAKRVLKQGGMLIVGEPWFPIIVKQFCDFILFPLMKAGDNKTFTHKQLKQIITGGDFTIKKIHKKGSMQIIVAKRS